MRSIIITGSGRSGTSMVAALFRNSGYFQGFDLLGPTPSNIYGYYEDTGITEINNLLLLRILRWPIARWFGRPVHRDMRSLWLAAPRGRVRNFDPQRPLVRLMRAYSRKQPFCYKDPRFCVTLSAWRNFLPPDTGFIVVYRHPDATVSSILTDSESQYNPKLPVSPRWAYTSWLRNYSRLLDELPDGGNSLFVHYDTVVSGRAIAAIANFSGACVDATQIDPEASKAVPDQLQLPVARRCRKLYQRILARSEADLAGWVLGQG